jgi:hypothetical protein
MAIARLHPEGGVFGSGEHDAGRARSRGKFSSTYLLQARTVFRDDRELAAKVSKGTITLKRAFRIVQEQKKRLPPAQPDAVPQLEGTKSQRLMNLAKRYPGGKYHADLDAGVQRIVKSLNVSYGHLKKSRWVLRKSPELAEAVLQGEISLNAAWTRLRALGNATKLATEQMSPASMSARSVGVTRAECNISRTV